MSKWHFGACKFPILCLGALMLALTAAHFPAAEASWDTVHVMLGEKQFEIPKKYYLESPLVEMFKNVAGLDDGSRDRLLIFQADELADNIPGYKLQDGKVKNDINARLVVLNDLERSRYLSSQENLWYARGPFYKDRFVESYPGKPWFKVFQNLDGQKIDSMWELLKQYPDSNRSIPKDISDYWIATCLKWRSDTLPTVSGKRVDCSSRIIFDNVMIEFDLTEQNLDFIDQVRKYLKATVMTWQRS
jgi:hypothetical protein